MLKPLCFFLVIAPALMMAQTNVAGTWLATTDIFGNPLHQRLTLEPNGRTLSGKLGNDKLEGTLNGADITFHDEERQRGKHRIQRHRNQRQHDRNRGHDRWRHEGAHQCNLHREARR